MSSAGEKRAADIDGPAPRTTVKVQETAAAEAGVVTRPNMCTHLIFTFLLHEGVASVAATIFMVAPGAVSANSCCLCTSVCVCV